MYVIEITIIIYNFVVETFEGNGAVQEVNNEIETGQKENIVYRTAKNSCQKYVFGRMYGKY